MTANSSFSYTLSGVMADYRYKISGGGTWTSEYPIHMVPRPIVDAVTTAIRLPAYMRHDDLLPVADDVQRIEAPIDSHLVFDGPGFGRRRPGRIVLLRRSVDDRGRRCRTKSTSGSKTICRPMPRPTALAMEHRAGFYGTEIFYLRPHPSAVRFHHPAQPTRTCRPRASFYLMAWLDGVRSAGPHHVALAAATIRRALSSGAIDRQPPQWATPGDARRPPAAADGLGPAGSAGRRSGIGSRRDEAPRHVARDRSRSKSSSIGRAI